MTTTDQLVRAFTDWYNATATIGSNPADTVGATIADGAYALDPGQQKRLRSMLAQDTACLTAHKAATQED